MLNEDTNVEELVDDILNQEPIIPIAKKHYLVELIEKLKQKVTQNSV